MKKFLLTIFAFIIGLGTAAARPTHVVWTVEAVADAPGEGHIVWTAHIDPEWHIYGMELPDYGDTPMPTATTFDITPCEGLELIDAVTSTPAARMGFDEALQLKLPMYEGTVLFQQRYKATATLHLSGTIHYMACTEAACTPPAHEPFTVEINPKTDAPVVEYRKAETKLPEIANPIKPRIVEPYWWSPSRPVKRPISMATRWLFICLFAVAGALIAIMTPGASVLLARSRQAHKNGAIRVVGMGALLIVLYLMLGYGLYRLIHDGLSSDTELEIGGEYAEFDNYDSGMEYAAKYHRPVLLYFTTENCPQCTAMDSVVFDVPDVRVALRRNYVVIKLHTSDRTPLPEPYTVDEDGETLEISTYGQRYAYLERHKFGTDSIPAVMLLNDDGHPLLARPLTFTTYATYFADLLDSAAEIYTETSARVETRRGR